MLSNKMTVSLMSLITIIALAFVATPAMADNNIGSALVMDNDVGHADGLQIPYPATDLTFTLRFDKPVDLAAANLSISVFDEDGGFLNTLAEADIAVGDASGTGLKDRVITITGDALDGATATTAGADGAAYTVKVRVAEGVVSSDLFEDNATKKVDHTITLLAANPGGSTDLGTAATDLPDVLKIALVGEPFSPITTATFQTHILLSEEPMGGFKADHIEVSEATVASVVKLASPGDAQDLTDVLTERTNDEFGDANDTPMEIASWRDGKLHLYLVTFTAKPGEKTVTIKIKNFAGMERPFVTDTNVAVPQEMYIRLADDGLTPGRDILTVKTKRDDPQDAKKDGLRFALPKDKVIPGSGYLVVAEDKVGSAIDVPGGAIDASPKAHERTAAQRIYNVIDDGDLPNLERFLANGGTIDVEGPQALVITEIMWGSDASLVDDNSKSQWIELYNAGAEYKTQDGDNTTYLIFYGPNETLPAVSTVHDRVGTVGAGGYWSIAGKGQSGRSGEAEEAGDLAAVVPTQAIISMQRAAGNPDGTMASSWAASVAPSVNFSVQKVGVHVGTPGAAPVAYPTPPTPPTVAPTIPVAGAADIMITEIMVDTGDGRLPQWIELTNVSGAEKSLAGWSLTIENSDADADVIGTTVNIDLSGTLGVGGGANAGGTMGKSLLLVGGSARSSSNLSGSERVVDISSQVGERGRYTFISTMAFEAALIPPQETGILTPGDTAGNLEGDWDLPMSDGGRSSLIRREMLADGTATMGTDANGWMLASSTSLVSGPATWYGSDEDAGTPGYDAGGPLPVELSHFRPARDKETGAVVITWATQSELNNAGFFIKRSQQRDGQFQVINATMIPGAGTTSEKQFYTYTDTTAQPNVVYYYQIEDVSLDGNRQTLTRGTRLKGHIGAAGKLTSTWGELKSSNE